MGRAGGRRRLELQSVLSLRMVKETLQTEQLLRAEAFQSCTGETWCKEAADCSQKDLCNVLATWSGSIICRCIRRNVLRTSKWWPG